MRSGVACALAVAVGLLAIAMWVPAGAGADGARAQACGSLCGTATVTYAGSIHNTVDIIANDGGPSQYTSEELDQSFQWSASWSGPLADLMNDSGQTLPWTSLTLSGQDSIEYPTPPGGYAPGAVPPQPCSDTLSTAPGQTFSAISVDEDTSLLSISMPSGQVTPTSAGGCQMPGLLSCPTGSLPGKYGGTYCDPGVSFDITSGSTTVPISGGYGPIDLGGKQSSSTLSSTVTVTGMACQGSGAAGHARAAGGGAPRASAAAVPPVDIDAYERDGGAVKRLADLSDKPYYGTVDVVVGQLLILGVDCSHPNRAAPGPYAWKVPKLSSSLRDTSAIGSYTIDAGARNATSLDQEVDRMSSTLELSFIRTGSFKVAVSTSAGDSEVTFHVVKPQLMYPDDTFSFCSINTANRSYTSPHHNQTSPPTLGIGLNDECHNQPGVAWDASVRAPNPQHTIGAGTGAGEIAMVQTFAKTVLAGDRACVNVADLSDPSGWPADDRSFYDFRSGHWNASAGAGRVMHLADSDSPMIPLQHEHQHYTLRFGAHDYLMYRSAVPGSSWIPIAEQTWRFDGTAHFVVRLGRFNGKTLHGLWRLSSGQDAGNHGTFYDGIIAPLPQWSRAAEATGLPRDC